MSLLPSAARVSDALRTNRISGRALWLLVFVPVVLGFLACGHWTLNNADSGVQSFAFRKKNTGFELGSRTS